MSSNWYAFENIEEAIEDTKNLLTPFEFLDWVKISIILIFIGGGLSSFPSGGFDEFDNTGNDFDSDLIPEDFNLSEDGLELITSSTVILGLAIGALALVLVRFYLSGLFRFIYFQNLHDTKKEKAERIFIISNLKKNLSNGFNYLLVYFAITLLILLLVSVIVGSYVASLGLGLVVSLISLPVWLLIGLSLFFIRSLLIPEMMMSNNRVISDVKTVYGYVLNDWKQAGIFVVVKTGLDIVIGIAWFVLFLIGLVVLLVPLAIIGALFYSITPGLVVIPVILGLVGLLVINFAARVPLATFVYHYTLGVYEDFAEKEK